MTKEVIKTFLETELGCAYYMTLRGLTFVTFKPPHKSYLGDKRGKAVEEEAKQDNAFA